MSYLQCDGALPLDGLAAQGDLERQVLAVSVVAKLQVERVVETPLHLFGQPLEIKLHLRQRIQQRLVRLQSRGGGDGELRQPGSVLLDLLTEGGVLRSDGVAEVLLAVLVTAPTCIPFQRRYPAHPASVSRVRQAITDAAHHGILGLAAQDSDLADVLRLIASELVTNAITHTEGDPDDLIEVTLWTADDHLWLAVADTSADPPVLREPDDAATCGRGLLLVAALAMTWGVIPRMAGAGKVVFAGVRLP